MGNASSREDGGANGIDDPAMLYGRSNEVAADGIDGAPTPNPSVRLASSYSTGIAPPVIPGRSRSPLMSSPQQCQEGLESQGAIDSLPEKGIPTLITWSHGGNSVAVVGSWDDWKSRTILQRSGKDHSLLLVLPSGIYHYKFVVDGESRYMPDLPYVSDDTGEVYNVLDVHVYAPEILDGVAEFEAPQSPDSSYGQVFPGEDDYAKDPVAVPPQLQLTVVDMQNSDDAAATAAAPLPRPQHVVLNHLFIEKGWASQSVVALGLTHRFESKYVTVVLYKPRKR
ncbi:hypothetical protein Nepgr_014392 [Nepenthes gracilis]|uniref:Association with the SNF1 complex (ASC) domain-containing protein n=1 Tax=Nepenthes gracilis TaxID=150966 RepID=A0AAD3SLR8_NEPGR|nr:hypothetical protein Nepgr_014392 [Nepenthes gracilis]